MFSLKDEGVSYLTDALIEQAHHFKNPTETSSPRMNYSELSASLNYLNNNKCLSPSFKKPYEKGKTLDTSVLTDETNQSELSLLSRSNNNIINTDDEMNSKQKEKRNKEKSPPPPVSFDTTTQDISPLTVLPCSDEDTEVQGLLKESPDSDASIPTTATTTTTTVVPDVKSTLDIHLMNANVTEVATQTTTDDTKLTVEQDSSCDNNIQETSPLNTKSLKEELEDCVPSTTNNMCESDNNKIISPIIKVSDAIMIETTTVSGLHHHESKSLDTDSEIESIVKQVPLERPERSFSSESLNSITSIDSNDSKSSIRITEAKFAKNGTLERQQSVTNNDETSIIPTGLQVLLLWNNKLTKNSSKSIQELISTTKTLEIINMGRNNMGNDFLGVIKTSLRINTSLQSFGLQGCHLSCIGVKILADILEFGGNSTLQRIDLRDNNIQTEGLEALNDALKSNRSITQIDLDETPRKLSVSINYNFCYLKKGFRYLIFCNTVFSELNKKK